MEIVLKEKVNSDKIRSTLKSFFGFEHFKGQQEDIIKSILAGNHIFVIMPTGGGKSLCYQLPALILEGTAIIVSPLIALMKNQVDMIRGYNQDEGVAHFLNSSLLKIELDKVKQDVVDKKTKLLYLAPESLAKEENIEFLKKIKISFFAIDEAHCISEWGHDFRPEYRRLKPIIENISDVPIMALTATATPKVQSDIQKNLHMQNAVIFKSSFNRPNLYYEVRPKVNAIKEVIKYIKMHHGKSGIVYCLSRKKVEEVAEALKVNGIKALPYHAGLESNVRTLHQDMFLKEEVDVIVATIAFGMGIDKPDIRFVIHYDVPKSLEGYYQETGRGGRDGREGNCIAFYAYKDILKLAKFMKGKPVAEQEIGQQLLLETVAYSESPICRRKQLLNYFGEKYNEENCGKCDNCIHPKLKFEGKDEVLMVLEAVKTVKENFQSEHIVNIIIGAKSQAISTYKHNRLSIYGKGKSRDKNFWNSVVRQIILLSLLVKDIDNYGLLKFTKEGREFLDSPYSIQLTEHVNYDIETDEEDDVFGSGGTSTVDPQLFSLLKDLRKQVAKQHNLPPYVIFQDSSIEDMAIQYPISLKELTNITGVGEGKANRYGALFVELINKYVKENEIERPMDMVVKSVINKSIVKVSIIQNIDRKISLADLAKSKGLTMENILNEIESIVSSGTKLNIDYYINEIIDEERQEEAYEYFRSSESASLNLAVEKLGENTYSLDELKLMYIKFISEMGH